MVRKKSEETTNNSGEQSVNSIFEEHNSSSVQDTTASFRINDTISKNKVIRLIDCQVNALLSLRAYLETKERNGIDDCCVSEDEKTPPELSFNFKYPLHDVIDYFRNDLFVDEFLESQQLFNKSLSKGYIEIFSFDLFGELISYSPAVPVPILYDMNASQTQSSPTPSIGCISVLIHKIAEFFQCNNLKLQDKREKSKLFFARPHRHEIETIQYHLAVANNLSFLENVSNPSAIFWFLIHYLKQMEDGLIPPNQMLKKQVQDGPDLLTTESTLEHRQRSINFLVNDYYKYRKQKKDANQIILRQNLLAFQKEKLALTKQIFKLRAGDKTEMQESELFAGVPRKEESKQEGLPSMQVMPPSVFEDINKSHRDLWVSTWQCVLHIIDMIEALISSECKNHKLKTDYLYEIFTEAIFYHQNRFEAANPEPEQAGEGDETKPKVEQFQKQTQFIKYMVAYQDIIFAE